MKITLKFKQLVLVDLFASLISRSVFMQYSALLTETLNAVCTGLFRFVGIDTGDVSWVKTTLCSCLQ